MPRRERRRPPTRRPGPMRHPGRQGHTLTELLMSIAISSAALAMAFAGFSTLTAMLGVEQRLTDCQLEHGEIFTLLEEDIRNAGADPRSAGLYSESAPMVEMVPDGQALAGGLSLRSDRTGDHGQPDGAIDDAGEVVVYALDADTGILSRWAATGTGGMVASPLLHSVVSFAVDFEDAAGLATSSTAAVQVRVTLISRVDPRDLRLNAPIRRQTFSIVLQNRLLASL